MSISPKKNEYPAKLLILGDQGVGKTCIMIRFSDDLFPEHSTMTVGVDYKTKRVKVDDIEIKLTIWDTAGQEKYRSLAQNLYKGTMGIILVFDLTNKTTFDNLRNWIRQIRKNTDENVCKLIMGNKADSPNKQVTREMVMELVEEFDITYFEVSAMTGENVPNAFLNITKKILNEFYANIKSDQKSENKPFTLNPTRTDDHASGCCGS